MSSNRTRREHLKTPPILLHAQILFEDYSTVSLTHTYEHPVGTEHRQKEDLVFAPDPSDAECVLRVLDEFTQACAADRLHIDHGARYTHLSRVLGGSLRSSWDNIRHTIADADRTNANWNGHLRAFTRTFLPSNATKLQADYLKTAKKPFNMNIYHLSTRLDEINMLSNLLLGSNGNRLMNNDTDRKNVLYNVCLDQWQKAFDASGNSLDDNVYTYSRLCNFMEMQRIHHNASQPDNNHRRPADRPLASHSHRPPSYSPRTQYHNRHQYRTPVFRGRSPGRFSPQHRGYNHYQTPACGHLPRAPAPGRGGRHGYNLRQRGPGGRTNCQLAMHAETPHQHSDQYHASEPLTYDLTPPHDHYHTPTSSNNNSAFPSGTAPPGPPDDMYYQQDHTYPEGLNPADHYHVGNPEYGPTANDWMQDY